MDNGWYLLEYENKTYLHNKMLLNIPFLASDGTHDHCELCWARFSKHPIDFKNGYYEPKSKSWICPDCYRELAPLFGWTVE
jgi:hypothetical protein